MSDDLTRKTAAVVARWWRDRYTGANPDTFEQSLANHVELALRMRGQVILECDYDPTGILLAAVQAAEQEFFPRHGVLPMKHLTAVRGSSIEPKEGYGNWTDVIVVRS